MWNSSTNCAYRECISAAATWIRWKHASFSAHAIIGVTANTAEDIIKWKGKDVDYVGLGVHTTSTKNLALVLGTDGVKEVVDTVRKAGVELPIVAIGGLTLDDVDPLKAAGINGIAVSGAIINAPDPMLYTMKIMERLMDIPHD